VNSKAPENADKRESVSNQWRKRGKCAGIGYDTPTLESGFFAQNRARTSNFAPYALALFPILLVIVSKSSAVLYLSCIEMSGITP